MISPGGSSLSVRWPVSPLVVGAWWFPDLLAFFAARLALWALTVSLRLWATARAIEARVFAARPSAWQRPISRPFSGLNMLLTVSTRLRRPYAVCHAGVPYGIS